MFEDARREFAAGFVSGVKTMSSQWLAAHWNHRLMERGYFFCNGAVTAPAGTLSAGTSFHNAPRSLV